MKDRDVQVIIPLKASSLEGTRTQAAALQEFPAYAWHYFDQIEKLMLKEDASPEDGKEMAKLVAMAKMDCVSADKTVKQLVETLQAAFVSDPENRGPVQ